MKTYCFIGSDKNAGKTTALNFVYHKMYRETPERSICLTSVGINGELVDQYDGGSKPAVHIHKGGYFITAAVHLCGYTGRYEIVGQMKPPAFARNYVLARGLDSFDVVLEGPNTGHEITVMKKRIRSWLPTDCTVLIDGSIDRHFIASPAICDGVYFSVYFSKRTPQFKKAEEFLWSVSLPACGENIRHILARLKRESTKSLLLDDRQRVVYHGMDMPFKDKKLHHLCVAGQGVKQTLYLNGALSRSFGNYLAPLAHLTIILNHFSLYQNITVVPGKEMIFKPLVQVLNHVKVRTIFVRQERDFNPNLVPAQIPVVNLFRKDHDEIGI